MHIELRDVIEFLRSQELLATESPTKKTIAIERFASLACAQSNALCWTKKVLPLADIPECAVLLAPVEQEDVLGDGPVVLRCTYPRRAFAELIDRFVPERLCLGVDSTARVHPSAIIGQNVFIGPCCVIGADVHIGDESRIDAGVVLHEGVRIGVGCHISSGVVIGSDGHGYVLDEMHIYRKMRHLGAVVLGDYVDVGANACIDRGVLDDTRVGNHTKIDNLVQIAHNVTIGENCMITAGAIITGSCSVGNYCWLAPGSVLKNGVSIASEVLVGMNAVVYRSVTQEKVCLTGDPARATLPYEAR